MDIKTPHNDVGIGKNTSILYLFSLNGEKKQPNNRQLTRQSHFAKTKKKTFEEIN